MTIAKSTRIIHGENGGAARAAITTTDAYQWIVLSATSPILLPAYRVINGYDGGDDEAVELTVLASEADLSGAVDPTDQRWIKIVDADTLTAESDTQATIDASRYFTIAVGVKSNAVGVHSDLYAMLTGAV